MYDIKKESHDKTNRGKILIVEDSTMFLHQVEKHLGNAGFSVVTARNGLEAMDELRDSMPDLIISDIQMPGMDGYEFCRQIRTELGESVPFIFLSVKDDTEDKVQCFKMGCDDYLTKPFVMEELVARAWVNVERNKRFKRESSTDYLTCLLNRRAIESRLNGEIQRSSRFRRPFSLAMLDIDHFKNINDTMGHPTGDEILRRFARYVRSRLRTIDIVGRYGGEEFLIMMPETMKEEALIPLERIRAGLEIENLTTGNGSGVPLRVSVGAAEYPADGATGREIIKAADKALYQSKSNGRNCVTLYGKA